MSAKRRLDKARKRRHQIAHAFSRLENREIDVHDVLEDNKHVLGYVSIWDLLRRSPKMGPAGAKKVLQKSHVWPEDRVSSLTMEQRRAIMANLPPRVKQLSKVVDSSQAKGNP